MVVHVQYEVLPHDSQANHTNVTADGKEKLQINIYWQWTIFFDQDTNWSKRGGPLLKFLRPVSIWCTNWSKGVVLSWNFYDQLVSRVLTGHFGGLFSYQSY